MKKRALVSVWDKTGIVEFCGMLIDRDFEILSTGGTKKILQQNNLPVTSVSDITGFGSIMDGRVKTINPLIEGGILGLRDVHNQDATDNDIKWIDLVVCNFLILLKLLLF